jgi:hypothetical protein
MRFALESPGFSVSRSRRSVRSAGGGVQHCARLIGRAEALAELAQNHVARKFIQ